MSDVRHPVTKDRDNRRGGEPLLAELGNLQEEVGG